MASEKKSITFRLPVYLIARLKELAKRDNMSLNSYVEMLLLDAVYNEPNAETLAAMEEARTGKLQGPLDVSSAEAMLTSMGL